MAASFVRITASNRDRLLALQDVPDLDIFRHTARQLADDAYSVDGLLSHEQIGQLRSEGYGVELVADADQVAMERRRDLDALKCQPNDDTLDFIGDKLSPLAVGSPITLVE
jgi:hypothetical protein